MKTITENIRYVPASESPLSADVVLIKISEKLWLYDVGNDPNAITSFMKEPVTVVLSHFHPDHCGNLPYLNIQDCYCCANTLKYIHSGKVIEQSTYFENGLIHLFPIPSTHAKGCLGLEIDDYVFVGDSLYSKNKNGIQVYNANLVKQQISLLENLKAKYVGVSHKTDFIQPKCDVIEHLIQIYNLRDPQSPYIALKDEE